MKKYSIALLFIPLMTSANEEFEPHWYLSGSIGYGLINVKTVNDDNASFKRTENDNDFTYEISGGYKFSEYLGLSGGYRNLGSYSFKEVSRYSSSPDIESSTYAENEISAFFMSLDGYYPLSTNWILLGKVGFNLLNSKENILFTQTNTIDGSNIKQRREISYNPTEAFFSLGIERKITQDLGFTISYFNHSGIDLQELKAGLTYSF